MFSHTFQISPMPLDQKRTTSPLCDPKCVFEMCLCVCVVNVFQIVLTYALCVYYETDTCVCVCGLHVFQVCVCVWECKVYGMIVYIWNMRSGFQAVLMARADVVCVGF